MTLYDNLLYVCKRRLFIVSLSNYEFFTLVCAPRIECRLNLNSLKNL